MNINSSKTEVLEGEDVVEQALLIEHSAIDEALVNDSNGEPLEQLIERLLSAPEMAGRTSLKFAISRMRQHERRYRIMEFPELAPRMPHGADALAELFKQVFVNASLQEWFLDYAAGPWASFEWSIAHYLRMFPSDTVPASSIVEFTASRLADSNTSLPLAAVCAQRLAAWDAREARNVIRSVEPVTSHPQHRRVLAMAALAAGERRSTIRKWLSEHDDNVVTLRTLEEMSFSVPEVDVKFA